MDISRLNLKANCSDGRFARIKLARQSVGQDQQVCYWFCCHQFVPPQLVGCRVGDYKVGLQSEFEAKKERHMSCPRQSRRGFRRLR